MIRIISIPKIRHYCDNSLNLLMALPSENPVLAANLQLVLSRAPGSDLATEALRKALLGVAATHQSYLLSRRGATPEAEEAMFLANGFRSESKQLLSESFNIREAMQSDASLAASVSISLLDVRFYRASSGSLTLLSSWHIHRSC